MAAYNFARRLKTLSGLTPYEYICKIWTSEPDRFILNSIHQMTGLNNVIVTAMTVKLADQLLKIADAHEMIVHRVSVWRTLHSLGSPKLDMRDFDIVD